MTNTWRHDRFVVHSFHLLDSTNRYLLDEAANGAADGIVAVADNQSAGRGRRGRVWDSKPGSSLLFSVLFRPPSEVPLIRYTQAVGLAVVDACATVGAFTATLKWPNDVLFEGRKIAGVLSESTIQGDDLALVVGCGLNLNWNGELPEALSAAISADEAAGHAIDRDEMLRAVLTALAVWLSHPDRILEAYRARCSTLGQQVRIDREADTFMGKAVDLAEDGSLVVETDGRRETVSIGDVVHLRSV